MGENVQDLMSFPVVACLGLSVSLLAAIGSEIEAQLTCTPEIAAALYRHSSKGQKLAQHDMKNDCIKHTAHSRSWREEPQRRRTSLEAGISVGILPRASQPFPEEYKPVICLETVMICSTLVSKGFRQCLGLVVLCVAQIPLPQSGQMSWARPFRRGSRGPEGWGGLFQCPQKSGVAPRGQDDSLRSSPRSGSTPLSCMCTAPPLLFMSLIWVCPQPRPGGS